jgi:serine/threonine-protein kinase
VQPALLHQTFGRYELLVLLARGGMAEVYLARMSGVAGFAKLLVIKRILPHLSTDPEFVEMFSNEGRIAARLMHVNVCQVFELGEVDGDLFLAMEYLEGLTWSELSNLVPRGQGFELRCAAGVLAQICDGLNYAHELRDVDGTPTPVVHRDVSPHNLFVTTDGVCKLLDFGVAKVLTEGTRTRTGIVKGKLPYMAPEQFRGEAVDPRADVFSMGVVLWEALTGARLFKRDSDYQIWRAITEEPIPLVSEKQPGLPPAIDAVVARALEREADRRYPTIRMFASELRHVADQLGGVLDVQGLSEVVRSHGAAKLAERRELVIRALNKVTRDGAHAQPPDDDTDTDTKPFADNTHTRDTDPRDVAPLDSGARDSIQIRDRSVKLGRRLEPKRPRWLWIAVPAVASLVGVLAAVWSMDRNSGPTESPADVVARAAAAVPAAPVHTSAVAPPADTSPGEEDEQIDLDPVVPGGPARTAPGRRVHHREPAEPGQYSVDSKPYATIFIDGKSYGDTPLFKISVPAGRHRLRAVRADGRVKQLAITIEPGKLLSSGTLAW